MKPDFLEEVFGAEFIEYSMAFRICFFVMIVFVHTGYGQKQLFITPSLGMAFPLCYTITPPEGDSGYGSNTFDFGASFDLSLQYQINPKWIIFGGWRASGGDTGFSFKYGDRYKDYIEGRYWTASGTKSIPVGFMRYLSTQKWFKMKRRSAILENVSGKKNEDVLYLVLFKLRLLSGLSYNYVVPATNDNQLDGFSSGTYLYTVNKRNSLSPFIGFNFQFFNYHKNHFQLTILYSQGLSQVLTVDVDYQLLSGNHEAVIGSRGSYFSLQLGYPIKIYDASKKKRS
jgi:hypothetical protein